MENIVEIIENAFLKCSNLDIKTEDELLKMMWVMGFLNIEKINERIFDEDSDSDNLINFISDIKMFGMDSKGEVRKLIKNNGIKINNKLPSEKVSEIEWIKLNNIEFAVIKKGKKDFDFIFKNKNGKFIKPDMAIIDCSNRQQAPNS